MPAAWKQRGKVHAGKSEGGRHAEFWEAFDSGYVYTGGTTCAGIHETGEMYTTHRAYTVRCQAFEDGIVCTSCIDGLRCVLRRDVRTSSPSIPPAPLWQDPGYGWARTGEPGKRPQRTPAFATVRDFAEGCHMLFAAQCLDRREDTIPISKT